MTPFHGISSLLSQLRGWPGGSQHGSRRNAMVACTVLAQRRAEREDVEEFLASRTAEQTGRGTAHG